MNDNIIELLENLLKTLKKGKKEEINEAIIKLYENHIEYTNDIVNKIKTTGFDKVIIDQYFEREGRQYGWSYLPNENGRIAEETFFTLKRKLGYYEN